MSNELTLSIIPEKKGGQLSDRCHTSAFCLFQHPARLGASERHLGLEILLVGLHPVVGDVALSGLEIDLSLADEAGEQIFQLFGQVNNLFDTEYETAAQLGATGFTATGNFIARPFPAVNGQFPLQGSTFFAPGAPITAWGGVRVRF